jgi:hypothetical protein
MPRSTVGGFPWAWRRIDIGFFDSQVPQPAAALTSGVKGDGLGRGRCRGRIAAGTGAVRIDVSG